MESKHNYFSYGISSTMKILIFLFLLLLLPNIVNAAYDFDLKAKDDYRVGLNRYLKIDNIQVRNGLLNYEVRYEHPINPINPKPAGASTFSLHGEYHPKDKILEGQMEDAVSHGNGQSRTVRCGFYSTEITA